MTNIRAAAIFLLCILSRPVPASDAPTLRFLEDHCVDCHGADTAKGGLRLDAWDKVSAKQWVAVLDQLAIGEMPPRKRTRPDAAETGRAAAAISAHLSSEAARLGRPDRPAIRRMNRTEYVNTVRDLLGIDFEVGATLPQDDSAHGFDNVGEALNLSPLLLEKYLREAERITDRVLLAEKPELQKGHFKGTELVFSKSPEIRDGDAVKFFTVGRSNGGGAFFPTPIPFKTGGYVPKAAGKYRVRLKAHTEGPKVSPSSRWRIVYKPEDFEHEPEGCEEPRLVFVLDGEFAGRVHLTHREPAEYEFTTWVEPGQKFGFNFENGVSSVRQGWNDRYRGPAVVIHWIEVEGPIHEQWPTRGYRSVIPDDKAAPGDVIERFAARAYRRPVTAAETAELLAIYKGETRAGAKREAAIAAAVQRILCAPDFLFLNRPAAAGQEGYRLASRLSYFLWSSMPDDALFRAVADGSLMKNPEPHVRRMLADPRSRALVENFAGQWLQLRRLQGIAVDRALYPDYSDYLRSLFVWETEAYFREVLDRNLSILTFLDSDFAMVNDRLAAHYGIQGVEGHQLRRVALNPAQHRGGLLGQAGILTLTTCGTRTSPILRGVWVLESLLGVKPPPPPKDVPELPAAPRGPVSERKRLEAHREAAACAKCHDRIDPLGFPLEQYDVIGRWRTDYGLRTRYGKNNGPPVDAAADLTSGVRLDGPDALRQWLRNERGALFSRHFTERLLTYALGRGLDIADRPAVDALMQSLEKNGHRLSDLIVAIARSEPFNQP